MCTLEKQNTRPFCSGLAWKSLHIAIYIFESTRTYPALQKTMCACQLLKTGSMCSFTFAFSWWNLEPRNAKRPPEVAQCEN